MLYTDGKIEATREEAQAHIAELDAAASLAAREATRDEVQAEIDKDITLGAVAGLQAETDPLDEMWVVLVLPADAPDTPKFWSAVGELAMTDFRAKTIDGQPTKRRMRKDRAKACLTRIKTLLG